MADPAASAVVGATAVPAVVAGAGAYILTALGLEPGPLFWSLLGATIGMTWAASMPRGRAITVFICVVLVCSLAGAWLAVRFTSGEQLSRNFFACILAMIFHPLISAAITAIPMAIKALIRRFVGDAPETPS